MNHAERRVLYELLWMTEYAAQLSAASVRRDVWTPMKPRDGDGGDQ